MLEVTRMYDDYDTHVITTEFGHDRIKIETSTGSLMDSDKPEYFIQMGSNYNFLTEDEMLELVSALLNARKNWEDHKNGRY